MIKRKDGEPADVEEVGTLLDDGGRPPGGMKHPNLPNKTRVLACIILVIFAIAAVVTAVIMLSGEGDDNTFDQAKFDPQAHDVVISPADDRKYEYFVLPNELSVMLISDKDTDKAAAAMSVSVGHFSDPDDLPGLAHFCEHMLFMGSKKFPKENEYNEYLALHGGGSNAYTAAEETNYFFDIIPDALHGALDLFGQFFIGPLFSPDAVAREVQAVDAENSKNKLSDGWRINQLKNSLADPSHPMHKFGTGSLDTLMTKPSAKGVNTRERLLQFYHKHYSANRMRLVVYGKEDLAQLRTWVEEIFSEVPLWNSSRTTIPPTPFPLDKLPLEVHYVPVKELRSLTMIWPLVGSPSKDFQSKSHEYISHVLGHEAPGSVAAALKHKGWIESLYVGVGNEASSFGTFELNVELTDAGVDKVNEIVEAVYNYIDIMKSTGALEWIWQESKDLAALRFQFLEKGSPINYVSSLASNMQEYPPRYAVSAAFTYTSFDVARILSLLEELKPETMILMLGDRSFAEDETVKSSTPEPWYGTLHSVTPLLPGRLPKGTPWPDLSLINPNPFIPANFTLLHGAGSDVPDIDHPVKPEPVVAAGGKWMWFLGDSIFGKPKVSYSFELSLKRAPGLSQADSLCGTMFQLLLDDALEAVTYNARVAGAGFAFSSSFAGLAISFGGYNDKLEKLIHTVLSAVKSLEIKPDRFALKKDELRRSIANSLLGQPYSTALRSMDEAMAKTSWSLESLATAVEHLTVEEVKAWVKDVLLAGGCGVVGLGHGNLMPSDAVNAMTLVADALGCTGQPVWPMKEQSVADLTTAATSAVGAFHARLHPNKQDPNSALELVFQAGEEGKDLKEDINMRLLVEISREPCFDQLRTQQQLGYIVSCRLKLSSASQALSVVIQSGHHEPSLLDQRARAFINELATNVTTMPATKLASHKAAFLAEIRERPKNMGELTALLWGEISTGRLQFDRRKAMATALDAVTGEDIGAFATRVLQLPRSLAMWVYKGDATIPQDMDPEVTAGRTRVQSLSVWRDGVQRFFSRPQLQLPE